jgi:hypothetical protein
MYVSFNCPQILFGPVCLMDAYVMRFNIDMFTLKSFSALLTLNYLR